METTPPMTVKLGLSTKFSMSDKNNLTVGEGCKYETFGERGS